MSSKGSDDDEDDDKPPKPRVTVPEAAKWVDVRDVPAIQAADADPSPPRPRWRLTGSQTGWDLTFRIRVVVDSPEG